MKKTFFITVFTAVLAFSPAAYAQQDTTSGSDIQSQQTNSYYQDNAGSQQNTAELYETGGNDVLTSGQVEDLTVTGDSTPVDDNQPKSTLGWVFIAALFFVGLMMPALLYIRALNTKDNKAKALEKKPVTKVKAKEDKDTKPAIAKTTDSQKSEETAKPVKSAPKKKPAKKKAANKAKKAKKKRK